MYFNYLSALTAFALTAPVSTMPDVTIEPKMASHPLPSSAHAYNAFPLTTSGMYIHGNEIRKGLDKVIL